MGKNFRDSSGLLSLRMTAQTVMPPRQAFLPWLRHLKAEAPLALPCGKAG